MCGIIAQLNLEQRIDLETFERARDSMINRGPDGWGSKLLNDGKVALGHRRLSIIDLSNNGNQPLCNENNTIWLIFNGEIYNYLSLRSQLIKEGHVFSSTTDSEVIVHGYEQWGVRGLLDRIKGMFAFSLWDESKRVLFSARDRFGMKPFYYSNNDGGISISSSLDALKELSESQWNIDLLGLSDYLQYGYVSNPFSIWKQARKLPPGHYMLYDFESKELEIESYWKLNVSSRSIEFELLYDKVHELIDQSVKEHLASDVPVGLFLSGGYDSTVLLDYMVKHTSQVNTFSIGFENSGNSEHHTAKKVSRLYGSQHFEKVITNDSNVFTDLERLTEEFSEPFAISSMLPYYYVSELASEHNKVAFVGDGGDELFGGYKWHYEFQKVNDDRFGKLLRLIKYGGQKKYIISRYSKYMGAHIENYIGQFEQGISELIKNNYSSLYSKNFLETNDGVKALQYLDYKTFLPEPALTRADRTSMAKSLEVRVPFLDHELFELMYSFNSGSYMIKGQKKPILEQFLKRSKADFIINLPKRGFSFQFQNKLKNGVSRELIHSELVEKHKFLNPNFNYQGLDIQTNFKLLMLSLWTQKRL